MIPNSNAQAQPLSPERLAEIRARHAAAQGGHWHLDPEPHTDPDLVRTRVSGWLRYIGVLRFTGHLAAENRQFVLYAHDDVRLLLAEAARLAARVAELDKAADELIGERDRMEDVSDKLAYAVAPVEVIGEHSSMNDPWDNAYELITPAAEVEQFKNRVAELEATTARRSARLVALENDALNMRGVLSPNGFPRRVPMELGETLTPVVEWLLDRVAELEKSAQTRHCGRAMVHPEHRWMSARESVQCPGTEAGA